MQNQQTQKVKAYQLREKAEDALEKDLKQLKTELVSLRTSQVSSAPQVKLARIRIVRKGIAKILTVLNEKRRAAARTEWKTKKYTPKDLRYKGTKSSRRGLTKHQKALQTARAAKKASNFRPRKYAVAQ